ncbi:uncharacterized protein TRIADDRAFT_55425 [Trichoplax adhaerens]|uniref:G-protein coupled receptors family 3 profile domain-containing protein n=1 Tax=Trichoplax adhaerens TaxID=10228 RepID=B3RUV2_TRIAD|nr:hypothetical protein TRIADDRAFT_55425 [Trichoplax adhaerens]EDV25889.1 hypothetical protein TRIADDRAFT_55425 [Trichoplax adhaerens]|eukprot:XP_002111922.1 hypothetical protein TRIADDRAFT_55425 [Trichoplax adhaerens]
MIIYLLSKFVLLAAIPIAALCAKNKVLHLGGFIPMDVSLSGGWSASGILPALQMGFFDINQRRDILPDYQLNATWGDTHCLAGAATKLFVKTITNPVTKILLVGDGCSSSTQPIAEVIPFYNLVMISYSAGSPSLSDRKRYKTLFRMTPSDFNYNRPRVAIMKYFNWSRIATIYQSERSNTFSLTAENVINIIKTQIKNYEIVTTESVRRDPKIQIENLQRKDARIIVLDMFASEARLTFCWAIRLNFTGKNTQRVWFISGFYADYWWKINDTDCTVQELEKALEGVIITDIINVRTDEIQTISGMTVQDYQERLKLWPTYKSYHYNRYHPYGYDTTWAIALALNRTATKLANWPKADNLTLENFTYRHGKLIKDIIMESFYELNFEGVTGSVRFTDTGDRAGTVIIQQWRNGSKIPVAIYDNSKNTLRWIDEFQWKGDVIPSDGSNRILIVNYKQIPSTSTIAIVVISAIGIAISFAFALWNHKYRKAPLFEMNKNLIKTGVTGRILCEMWKWFIPLGFTTAYTALISKTFRIYIVYTSVQSKPRRKKLLDRSLIKLIMILLLIDVIYLGLWSILEPLQLQEKTVKIEVTHVDNADVRQETKDFKCHSKNLTYWILILSTEKALLLIIGMLLAYSTRNVEVKELNDSKLLTVINYNFMMALIITGPLRSVLSAMPGETYFLLDTIFIWFSVTIMLSLLFFTQFYRMMRRFGKISESALPGTRSISHALD